MKIPIKKFVDDTTQTWEERFKKLLAHHEEETKWMVGELKRLGAAALAELKAWVQKEFEANQNVDYSSQDHAQKAKDQSERERWERISRDSYNSWVTLREVIKKISELEAELERKGRNQE